MNQLQGHPRIRVNPVAYYPTSIYSTKLSPPKDQLGGKLYEDICRHYLRRRRFRVSVLTIVFLYIANVAFTYNFHDGIFAAIYDLFSFTQIALVFFTFICGIAPTLVLSKLYLSTISPTRNPKIPFPPTLYAQLVQLASERSTYVALSCYIFSGWFFTAIYCITAGMREWEDAKLSFVFQTTRNRFILNERFVFLAFSNCLLGALYACKNLLDSRSRVKWPTGVSSPPHRPNPVPRLQSAALPTLKRAALHAVIFGATYFVFRRTFWQFVVRIPILGRLIRPRLSFFLRSSKSPISFGILLRLLNLSVITSFMWEFSLTLWDVYASEPVIASPHSVDPNPTLLSGILSPDPYFAHHAYHELALVALYDETRRKELFADLKSRHPTQPSVIGAWAITCRELLLVLGTDYRRLVQRGKPPAPPSPPKVPTPPPAQSSTTPSTPLKTLPASESYRVSALTQSRSERILDSFSSEGEATKVMTEVVGAVNKIPKIFLSASTPSTPSKSGVAPSKPKSAEWIILKPEEWKKWGNEQVWSLAQKSLSPNLLKWSQDAVAKFKLWLWGVDKVRFAEDVLDRREMDCWCIEALANLTAHSLTEDRYGVVQRDIPKILEAFVKFSQALDAFVEELVPETAIAKDERELREQERVGELAKPLRTALRGGIHLIAVTFREKLEAFRFSPETAKALQAVVSP